MEDKGMAMIILATIGILVGAALWSTISTPIGAMTRTFNAVNATITMPAIGARAELIPCGQRVVSQTLTNATGVGETVPTTNYTITQGIGADGYLAAFINTTTGSPYGGRSVNVSCNFEPKGYVTEGGTRGLVPLIAIAAALLIVIMAMPNIRSGVLDFFRR